MKNVSKSDENWLSSQRIASKIFSMLKFVLQTITSNSDVQSQVNYLQHVCRALETNNILHGLPVVPNLSELKQNQFVSFDVCHHSLYT